MLAWQACCQGHKCRSDKERDRNNCRECVCMYSLYVQTQQLVKIRLHHSQPLQLVGALRRLAAFREAALYIQALLSRASVFTSCAAILHALHTCKLSAAHERHAVASVQSADSADCPSLRRHPTSTTLCCLPGP